MQTSVMLKFRASSVEGKPGSIYVQLIKGRKSHTSVIKEFKMYPHEWDEENESFRLNTSDPGRKAYLEECHERLMRGKLFLIDSIRELENRYGGYTLDDVLKSYYFKKSGCTLSAYAERVAQELDTQHARTARSYRTTANKVRMFNEGNEIAIGQINTEFVKGFEEYMRSAGNKLNTSSYYCRNLRALLNRAVEERIINPLPDNPFAHVFTGNEKTIKRAVKQEVIDQMIVLELEEDKVKHLRETRDMFLLSYYLRGISCIDMAYLKKENVQDGCIVYTRHKTGQYFEIEITSEIKAILDRYCTADSPYLVPLLRKGDSRKEYETTLRRENNYLKQLSALVGLDKPLTTYVARHSWASIAYAMGVSIDLISQGLGHENLRTTQIYLKSFDYSNLHKANQKIIRGGKSAV